MATPFRKQFFKKQPWAVLPFAKGKQQSSFCFSKGDIWLEYVIGRHQKHRSVKWEWKFGAEFKIEYGYITPCPFPIAPPSHISTVLQTHYSSLNQKSCTRAPSAFEEQTFLKNQNITPLLSKKSNPMSWLCLQMILRKKSRIPKNRYKLKLSTILLPT